MTLVWRPIARRSFNGKIKRPAWRSKAPWYQVSENDGMIPPDRAALDGLNACAPPPFGSWRVMRRSCHIWSVSQARLRMRLGPPRRSSVRTKLLVCPR
jgi:hypothetical protein